MIDTRNFDISSVNVSIPYPALCEAAGFGPAMYDKTSSERYVLEKDGTGHDVVRLYEIATNGVEFLKWTFFDQIAVTAYKTLIKIRPNTAEN